MNIGLGINIGYSLSISNIDTIKIYIIKMSSIDSKIVNKHVWQVRISNTDIVIKALIIQGYLKRMSL